MRICMVFALLVSACGSAGREAAWEKDKTGQGTTTSSAAATSAMAEAEGHWARRDDRAEIEKAIALWEQLVKADPNNAEAYVKLSRASYFLADGHLSLDPQVKEEDQLAVYTKGVN